MTSCQICNQLLISTEQVTLFPCNHVLCKECMIEGLVHHAAYKMSCPCGCQVKGHALTKECEVVEGNKKRKMQVQVAMDYTVPLIPECVLGSAVVPLLTDRTTFNELRVVSKGVHKASNGVLPPWPQVGLKMGESERDVDHIWEPARPNCVAFSPDSKTLMTANEGGRIRLWNREDGSCIDLELAVPLCHLFVAAFSEDGGFVVAVGVFEGHFMSHASCVSWDLSDGGHRCFPFPNHLPPSFVRHPPAQFCISKDGKHIAGCNTVGAYLWEVASGSCIQTREIFEGNDDNAPYSCVLSPDGQSLACDFVDWTIVVLNIKDGISHKTLNHGDDPDLREEVHVNSCKQHMVFSPDGKYLFVSNYSWKLRVWKISDGTYTERQIPNYICIENIPNDGDTAVAVCRTILDDNELYVGLFCVPSSTPIDNLCEAYCDITTMTFPEDGSALATAHTNGVFRLKSGR